MSHEVETMAYYGEVPWHKLGVSVDHVMTADEAIVAAGLDWPVKMTPVFVQNLKGHFAKVEGKFAVTRETDGKVFNILGNYYTPVQNQDAFAFFDAVAGSGGAKYETAGSRQYLDLLQLTQDIYGKETRTDSSAINLTESPIFIESTHIND